MLLRSDGMVATCGSNERGECSIPTLEEGVVYSQVVAGPSHTVLLRSDGTAVACGHDNHGQCRLPELGEGVTYTQATAGVHHTMLLRSDGTAVACGNNAYSQCDVPALPLGLTYTQVAAGFNHSLLIRSDGIAVAFGRNLHGQCDLPPPNQGDAYMQLAGGSTHTLLLRTNGTVAACGNNLSGQCSEPSLRQSWKEWFGFGPGPALYTTSLCGPLVSCVLQASYDGTTLCLRRLSGEVACQIKVLPETQLVELQTRILADRSICASNCNVSVVFPGGELLSQVISHTPTASVSPVCEARARLGCHEL